jgi:uncharacterized membrane protein YdjX (TVP38/TMEM64 family)
MESAAAKDGSLVRRLWAAGANKRGLRRFIGPKRAVVILLVMGGAWYLRHEGLGVSEVMGLVELHPISACFLFLLVYAVSVVALVPTLPFNLAAGVMWGTLWGGLLSAVGASSGAILAFVLARYVAGQFLAERFEDGLMSWIQQELLGKGWRFVAFLRVNPIVPTGPVNYLLGLTSIGIWPYSAATVGFITPPSLLVAWIGSSAGAISLSGNAAAVWRGTLGLSAAVTATVLMRYLIKYFSGRERFK